MKMKQGFRFSTFARDLPKSGRLEMFFARLLGRKFVAADVTPEGRHVVTLYRWLGRHHFVREEFRPSDGRIQGNEIAHIFVDEAADLPADWAQKSHVRLK